MFEKKESKETEQSRLKAWLIDKEPAKSKIFKDVRVENRTRNYYKITCSSECRNSITARMSNQELL